MSGPSFDPTLFGIHPVREGLSCPWCTTVFVANMALDEKDRAAPVDGDLASCGRCGGVMVHRVGPDGQLRLARHYD